jgi:TrmH family RNA methyltransferase
MSALCDTRTPQGVMAVVPILAAPAPLQNEKSIYLHEIQDPGNLGTILRTLAWFGGFRCLLSPASVDPYNPKVVRASMGAIFSVPIEIDVGIDQLVARQPRAALLDASGTTITDPHFKGFDCYVFGNEARGLPNELIAQLGGAIFSIHGRGPMESLNVSTAVNLCVYELLRS